MPCAARRAGLDLLADLLERRHVLADRRGELGHRLVHLLLHLRLVELREQALTLAQLLLERHRVLLHGALGRVGVLRGFEQHRPEVLDLALERDEPVRERLRGRLVLRAPSSAVALGCRLVGEQQRLARVPRHLVELFLSPVEPHLRLLLVRDDVRGLLGEAPVLILRFRDRLLELDLRIGVLLEAARELRRHVLPPPPHELEHARQPTSSEPASVSAAQRVILTPVRVSVGRRGLLRGLGASASMSPTSPSTSSPRPDSSETSPAESDSSTARATASSRRASSTSSRWRASVATPREAFAGCELGFERLRPSGRTTPPPSGASGREPRIRSRWSATSFSVERLHARRRARRPAARPASTPAPQRRSARRSRPAGRVPGPCGRRATTSPKRRRALSASCT